jgi:hypothetical protein
LRNIQHSDKLLLFERNAPENWLYHADQAIPWISGIQTFPKFPGIFFVEGIHKISEPGRGNLFDESDQSKRKSSIE